ncbi:collagen alpha-1(III) chain-like [Alligator mississippiensis]|uniref:collagen alpha-1(III) chain-like n=1 Tax=Alligator mississippiensis TaxID=8496 RepID=UPI0028779360|nr:collagen alpha-1(III) chain-like [Alligator mississippiensis]XP_059582515.1 collagen alpha-1(III) chain-like [Alligator mississippiensis]XP_059582516.1 collagen alpha-1(III) chain-like [Alligator mississippiensis]
MRTYVSTGMREWVCMHSHLCLCERTCMHAHVGLHMCVCACMLKHTWDLHVHARVHLYPRVCMHICARVCSNLRVPVHVDLCMFRHVCPCVYACTGAAGRARGVPHGHAPRAEPREERAGPGPTSASRGGSRRPRKPQRPRPGSGGGEERRGEERGGETRARAGRAPWACPARPGPALTARRSRRWRWAGPGRLPAPPPRPGRDAPPGGAGVPRGSSSPLGGFGAAPCPPRPAGSSCAAPGSGGKRGPPLPPCSARHPGRRTRLSGESRPLEGSKQDQPQLEHPSQALSSWALTPPPGLEIPPPLWLTPSSASLPSS